MRIQDLPAPQRWIHQAGGLAFILAFLLALFVMAIPFALLDLICAPFARQFRGLNLSPM